MGAWDFVTETEGIMHVAVVFLLNVLILTAATLSVITGMHCFRQSTRWRTKVALAMDQECDASEMMVQLENKTRHPSHVGQEEDATEKLSDRD